MSHQMIRAMYLACLAALIGCRVGGGDVNVAGNWHGTISNSCDFTMNLTQASEQVNGT